jgi:hypothetical protein
MAGDASGQPGEGQQQAGGSTPSYGEDNAWIREICEREETDPELKAAVEKECAKYRTSGP